MESNSLEGVRIVIDVDGTLCEVRPPDVSYADVAPHEETVAVLRDYWERGAHIVLHTSRQMRTYDGNLGLICVHTLPVLVDWLRKHNVPFHEIILGKL